VLLDLLDQFTPAPSSVPPPAKPPAASASTSTKPSVPPASDEFSEDFEAALAREMEAMMRGAEGPGGPSSASTDDMAAAWQKMLIGDLEGTDEEEDLTELLKSLGAGTAPSVPTSSTSARPTPAPDANTDDAFQRNIQQAMDKLKASDTNARETGSEADSLAQLLKQLGDMGGEGGEGAVGEEGLQGMIESMMGQLMGKEILYEPLVELDSKVSLITFFGAGVEIDVAF
jgi:peroxin-19